MFAVPTILLLLLGLQVLSPLLFGRFITLVVFNRAQIFLSFASCVTQGIFVLCHVVLLLSQNSPSISVLPCSASCSRCRCALSASSMAVFLCQMAREAAMRRSSCSPGGASNVSRPDVVRLIL